MSRSMALRIHKPETDIEIVAAFPYQHQDLAEWTSGDTPYLTIDINQLETPEAGEYVIEFIYGDQVLAQEYFTIRQGGT